MGVEHVGQVVQMLIFWGPISLLFVAILRLLWRAGDRRATGDLAGAQHELADQIEALTREIKDLRGQLREVGSVG
jgi:hypothetical protein